MPGEVSVPDIVLQVVKEGTYSLLCAIWRSIFPEITIAVTAPKMERMIVSTTITALSNSWMRSERLLNGDDAEVEA